MKHRTTAVALALAIALSLTACGNKNETTADNTASSNVTADAGATFDENSVYYAYDKDSDSAFQIKNGNWTFASTTTNRKHSGHLEDGTLICDIDSMKSDISYEIGKDSITFDVDGQTLTLSFVDGAEYTTQAQLINNNIRNNNPKDDSDSIADTSSIADNSEISDESSETESENSTVDSSEAEDSSKPEKEYIYQQNGFTQRPDGPMIDNNNYDNAYLNPSLWDQYDPSMKGDPDSLFPYGSPYVDWVGMNVGKTWFGLDKSYTYDDYTNNNTTSADKSVEFDLIVKPVNDRSETDFDSVEDINISYTLNIDDKVYFGSVPAKDLAWPASTKYDYMIESQGATIIWSIYDYAKTPLGEIFGKALIMSLHIEDGDYVTDRYLYAILNN